MKKKAIIGISSAVAIVAVIIGVLFITHVLCIHKWIDATCTEPKTCSICDKTEGKALGHDATDWKVVVEPTCSAIGRSHAVCNRCNEELTKDIEKLPHTKGKWAVTKNYEITPDGLVTPGVKTLTCSVCGEEMKTKDYTIELTLAQKNAIIKAYEEIDSWHGGRDFMINTVMVEFDGFSYKDAKFAIDTLKIDWDEQAVLYAKQNIDGMSKKELIEQMRYNKFNDKQIDKALKEIGY